MTHDIIILPLYAAIPHKEIQAFYGVFNLELYLPIGIGQGFFKRDHWEFVAHFQLCFMGFGE